MLIGKMVRLRRYEKEDLDRVLGWINDREVTRFLAARYPFTRSGRGLDRPRLEATAGRRHGPSYRDA
jgi:hypothetical protein